MIISPGRRYVFVHIPKTGGTALTLALEARAMADDILIGDTPKAKRRVHRLEQLQSRGRLWKHSTLVDIEGVLPSDVMAKCQIVTLVRNPWDRLVSYYHWLRDQKWDHIAVTAAKELSFDQFLSQPAVIKPLQQANYATYVQDSTGQEHRPMFIRLEHLDEDIQPFEKHLGFRISPLERVNASNRKADYRSYYTPAMQEKVAKICAKDIIRFGYVFE